jgi:7,8-dihydro-6-hydroxymethylpterin dimethyltransferase
MHPAENAANTVILNDTQSVCPVCLKVIAAQVVAVDKTVYLKKTCPDHGPVTAYLWPDLDHYNWMKAFRFPYVRPQQPTASKQGCPQDCGLCSAHLRHPTLVEIELTQRCNMRCPVCFMAADEVQAAAQPDPDLTAIEGMYRAALAKTGPQTSIQLTGGEPTVRRDLPEIVRLGRDIGFTAIEINTNGMMIARDPNYIEQLAEAGISGIYLQFDGLSRSVFEKIRGEDLLDDKLRAIEHCRAAGVQVVLAMTVIGGINHDQLGTVLDFALQNRDVIAGIAYQPAFGSGRFDVAAQRRLTMGDVAFLLAEQSHGMIEPYDLWPLACSHPLCDSATYIIEDQGTLKPLTRVITPQEYIDYFDPDSPQGSVLPDIAARMFPQLDPGLSIVVMNFMDAMSMDLARLRECSMVVEGPDGRMIPFCGYQLTNTTGKKQNSK